MRTLSIVAALLAVAAACTRITHTTEVCELEVFRGPDTTTTLDVPGLDSLVVGDSAVYFGCSGDGLWDGDVIRPETVRFDGPAIVLR